MAPRESHSRLRERRASAGLTQAELAVRAGVSRQLVAAVESGQNAPSVEAGIGLARALGTTVEDLFASEPAAVVSALGDQLRAGVPLRVGRVGDRFVAAELAHRGAVGDVLAAPDGVIENGRVRIFAGAVPAGFVISGCDPALGVAEARLPGVLALAASTGAALDALAAGRIHAAVVHGPPAGLPSRPVPTVAFHMARWQVGLGVAERLRRESLETLLQRATIVQRDQAAASQEALARAAAAAGVATPAGPRARGHLEAARIAATLDGAAVTTEGAAAAFGLSFRPFEEHTVQVWLSKEWEHLASAQAFANLVASAAFTDRVKRFGGYDLAGCGTRV